MRKLGVLLAAGLLLFSVVSCSTKKKEDVSAGSATTEAQSTDDETTTTEKRTTTTDDSDSSDGSDSSDDIPALGDLGDCLEVSLTYAGLFLGATFATDDQKAELEEQLDDIRGKVPADIQDDMDTIQQGMSDADGIVELGEFLDSDEFEAADENIQEYFEETCGTGSSGN
jgi:hypothetical protein